MTYQIGDPNHLGVHNDTVARIAAVAARGGIAVTLPDTAHLGDTGHVDDHNLIVAALAAIEAAPPGLAWAKVSGGTVTEYTHPEYGLMSVHTFTADGTLTVSASGFARVLLVGGGSGGVAGSSNGEGGRLMQGYQSLPSGALPVVVGAGGAGGDLKSNGLSSSLGTLATGITGPLGSATPVPNGWVDDITGTAVTYAIAQGYNGSAAPRANCGDGGSQAGSAAGSSGVVIVAVKKPAP